MLERTPDDLGFVIPPYTPLPDHLPLVSHARLGSVVYVSGQIPDRPDAEPMRGQLGAGLDVGAGREAARRAALNAVAVLAHVAGDLNRVRRIVKVVGFVSSAPGFVDQPAVVNGASEVFTALWGDANGKHARSAIGVAALPLGVPVEIEVIAELEEDDATAR